MNRFSDVKAGLIAMLLGLAGCTGPSIETGVPKDAPYVPLPQPGVIKQGKNAVTPPPTPPPTTPETPK